MTREEAINMLKSKMDGHTDTSYEWTETVRMAIKALEQTRWIPVSERLPEEDDFYLVTVKVGNELIVDISEYTPKNDFWDIPHDIVAWMPLPTPYDPQESEGEE